MEKTALELNAELLQELSTVASDENMVKDIIRYIRRLRRSRNASPAKPYTAEEPDERIDRAEKEYAEGRYTASGNVHEEINRLLNSL